MSTIHFSAMLVTIRTRTILRLPVTESKKLPSRGMVLMEGTINGTPFIAVLEPDGRGSHWFSVDTTLRKAAGIKEGDMVRMSIEPSRNRWCLRICTTRSEQTRGRRIAAACDKLGKGERRPCCFNRTLCTDTEVSHNGVLLDPS